MARGGSRDRLRAMNLVGELRAASVPRSDALASAVARRLDSPFAMLGIGLAYYLLVANDVLLGAGYGLFLLGRHLYGVPLPGWYLAVSAVALIPLLWVAFWPFRWWKRRRVAASLDLGRSGHVIDGEIAEWRQRGRGWHAVIWFTHEGREHAVVDNSETMRPAERPVGAPVPLLYAPHLTRALCFTSDGDAVPGRVQDGPRTSDRI